METGRQTNTQTDTDKTYMGRQTERQIETDKHSERNRPKDRWKDR